jgi:ABC-type transport system involved in multi-copper enzyme maturation permease subunit
LFQVELTRLRSRRAIVVLVAGAFVIAAVLLANVLWSNRPVAASELAAAQQQAQQQTQSRFVQRDLRRCETNPERFFGPGASVAECQAGVTPQADWFLDRQQLNPVNLANDLPLGIALFAGVIAVLIGATMIGAEWSAGSVGTQLLFEPRRSRVWTAKALAVAAATAVMALLLFVLVWTGILLAYQLWNDTPLPAGFTRDLAEAGLRVVAFTAVAGLAGYAITMAVRHTVVVVGLMLACAVVGEGLLREFRPQIEPWLVSNNTFAWIQGGHTISVYPEGACSGFRGCRPTETVLSLADAAIYFGVVAGAMLVISVFVFDRRDVP